jgi:hypothetical protein
MDEPRVIWEQRQWRRPGREQQPSGIRRIPGNNSGIYDPDSSPFNPETSYSNPGSGDSSSHASTAFRTIERIATQPYAYADAHSEADANADPKTETHANTKTNAETQPETDTKGDRKTDGNAQTVP